MSFVAVLRVYIFQWFWKTVQFLLNLIYKPTLEELSSNACLSYRVLKEVKPLIFYANSYKYFLLKYTGTKDISWIEKKNVCLYAVEDDYYVFARAADECGDILNRNKYPFQYEALRCNAVEIFKVRKDIITDYIHGLDDARKVGSNLYFLHNTGRCGSTLVTAILHASKKVKVISEPSVILTLITAVKARGGTFLPSDKYYPDLLEAIRNIMILTTPCPDEKYFIKFHPFETLLLPLVKEAIPRCHQIFLYRSLLPNVQSFYKIQQIFETYGSPAEIFFEYTYERFDGDDDEAEKLWRKKNVKGDQKLFCYHIMNKLYQYQKEIKNRSDFPAFLYEDILQYKPQFCKKLLSLFNVAEEFAAEAIKGLEKDAQENSPVSRESLRSTKQYTFSEETLDWCKDLAKRFGLYVYGPDLQFERIKGTVDLQDVKL